MSAAQFSALHAWSRRTSSSERGGRIALKDLLVVTKDCRIRFYNLNSYEGLFLREVANCHRGAICDIDVSMNSGYMLTAGEDKMVKIWDYEA